MDQKLKKKQLVPYFFTKNHLLSSKKHSKICIFRGNLKKTRKTLDFLKKPRKTPEPKIGSKNPRSGEKTLGVASQITATWRTSAVHHAPGSDEKRPNAAYSTNERSSRRRCTRCSSNVAAHRCSSPAMLLGSGTLPSAHRALLALDELFTS